MGQYVDFYCKNDNYELKKIVNHILSTKFAWLPQKDYDDLYSIASTVVWDCEKRFDSTKVRTEKFQSFLNGYIQNKIKTYVTAMNRNKRIAKDKDGNPIQNVSLDAPIGDDETTFGEYLSLNINDVLDNVLLSEIETEIKLRLPDNQIKLYKMILEGYRKNEIQRELSISNTAVNNRLKKLQNFVTKYLTA